MNKHKKYDFAEQLGFFEVVDDSFKTIEGEIGSASADRLRWQNKNYNHKT